MTDQDVLSIRGQFLAEAEQAEEELASHRKRSLQLATGLRMAAEKIEKFALSAPSGEDCEAGPHPTQQLPQQTYEPIFDYSKVVSTLTDLRQARLRIYNLRQRKAMLSGRQAINTI